jgi:hypothetical protein
MTPEQHDILIEIRTKMSALISDDHATGLVPEIKAKVSDHDNKFAYYKGAIAVVSVLLLALGGVIWAHVMYGSR